MKNLLKVKGLDSLRKEERTVFQSIIDSINGLMRYQEPIPLTDGATINWNLLDSYNAYVTIQGNRTLAINNAKNGDYGTIKITQGSGGSKTITLPTTSKVGNGGSGAVTLSTTEGQYDLLSFYVDELGVFNWTISNNFN